MAAAPEYLAQAQRTALIVDDSRLACAVLGRLLEQEGFHVEMAASGQEALDRLRRERPDVVFMDHLMPGMTGLEAVRTMKSDARTASIPVVMFSSQEDAEFVAASRKAGAVAVLTKHTERTDLPRVLEELGRAAALPPPSVPAAPRPVPATAALTRGELRAEMTAMLREQRDQIRTELLAEFAILENHHESAARALVGRFEAMLQRRLARISDEVVERLTPPTPHWAMRIAQGGLVAAALTLLAIPIGLALDQQHRADSLVATLERTQATLRQQSAATAALARDVETLGRDVAEAAAGVQTATRLAVTAAQAGAASAETSAAAVPLAELLEASGIGGAAELRVAEGVFCLLPDGPGYRVMAVGPDGRCAPGSAAPLLAGVAPAAAGS